MLRSAATLNRTDVQTRATMRERKIGNEATTPTASAGLLYLRSIHRIGRFSACSVRLFKD
jgi:hypothetical protein